MVADNVPKNTGHFRRIRTIEVDRLAREFDEKTLPPQKVDWTLIKRTAAKRRMRSNPQDVSDMLSGLARPRSSEA